MSRRVNDINLRIAYITNRKTGPILKTFKPLRLLDSKVPKLKLTKSGAANCQRQLTELLECINKHEDNSKCVDAFKALAKCNKDQEDSKKQLMTELLSGKRVDNQYHPKIWKGLLKKYPDCQSKKGRDIERNLLNTLKENHKKEFPFEDRGRPFNKPFS